MKIVVRGGSVAAGCGVEKGYVDILKFYYRQKGCKIINRSRARDTSFDGVNSFDEDIDPLKPDILMIHFGIDDAFFPVYRSEFKENLVHMIRRADRRFHPDIVLVMSHLLDNPREREAVDIYHRVIREVACDFGCTMIPIHTYWAGYLSQKCIVPADLLLQDSRYPNERGHGVYAEAVIHWLSSLYGI